MKILVRGSLKQIKSRQCKNGGFGMWSGDNSNLYLNCQVMHTLAICKQKGFSIPGTLFRNWPQNLYDCISKYLDTNFDWIGNSFHDKSTYTLIAYSLVIKFNYISILLMYFFSMPDICGILHHKLRKKQKISIKN